MAIKGVTAQETLNGGRIGRLMDDYHWGMCMLTSDVSRKEQVTQAYCGNCKRVSVSKVGEKYARIAAEE